MSKRTFRTVGGNLLHTVLDCAIAQEPSLIGGVDAGLAEVFEDGDLVESCMSLFENDLNISLAAQKLYMHRNTLLYRIKKIKRLTGLEVTKFSDAVTFVILYRGYLHFKGVK